MAWPIAEKTLRETDDYIRNIAKVTEVSQVVKTRKFNLATQRNPVLNLMHKWRAHHSNADQIRLFLPSLYSGVCDVSLWMSGLCVSPFEEPHDQELTGELFSQFRERQKSCYVIDIITVERQDAVNTYPTHRHVGYGAECKKKFVEHLRSGSIVRGWVWGCGRKLDVIVVQIVAVEIYEAHGKSSLGGDCFPLSMFAASSTILGCLPLPELTQDPSCSESHFVPSGTPIRAVVQAHSEEYDAGVLHEVGAQFWLTLDMHRATCMQILDPLHVNLGGPLGIITTCRNRDMVPAVTGDDFIEERVFSGGPLISSNDRLLFTLKSDPRFSNMETDKDSSTFLKPEGYELEDLLQTSLVSSSRLIQRASDEEPLHTRLMREQAHLWSNERVTYAQELLKKGHVKEGMESMNQAIEIARDNPDAYVARGSAYINLDLYEKAVADFDSALKLSPNNVTALTHKQNAESKRSETLARRLGVQGYIFDDSDSVRNGTSMPSKSHKDNKTSKKRRKRRSTSSSPDSSRTSNTSSSTEDVILRKVAGFGFTEKRRFRSSTCDPCTIGCDPPPARSEERSSHSKRTKKE